MVKRFDLSGEWKLRLDAEKKGIKEGYYKEYLEDTICLPGTTAEWKKGEKGTEKAVGYLTEPYHFEGYAWYGKEIEIPEEYAGETCLLYLERTRKSYVWVDENMVGEQDSFSAAHCYDLTEYVKGNTHRLTIMVSNTDYKTRGGHMTSPDTQTNWNGILGEISLRIYGKTRISDVQLFPSVQNKCIEADIEIMHKGEPQRAVLSMFYTAKEETDRIVEEKTEVNLKDGRNTFHLQFALRAGGEPALWNEYTPNLYTVLVQVETEDRKDFQEETIGFRDLKTTEKSFYLNDLPILLRGKHDGLVFPLTGYAPMEKETWKEVFGIAKQYGINHYRFHTCCPPKAAFEAADEAGIYLEPELPFWGTIAGEGEEGYEEEQQNYLIQEGFHILKMFGNHPSFLLFSLGNELWGNAAVLNEILRGYKEADKRHWYTQGSNNFQFAPVVAEQDDFFCGVRFSRERLFRGSYAMCDAPQGHVQTRKPENEWSYDAWIRPAASKETEHAGGREIVIQYGTGTKKVQTENSEELTAHIPVVSHEIGQYAFYPNFKEISKYTGVLQPENLKIFRKRLEEKGMLFMAEKFFVSSGKLAVGCYKRELETAFRSEELAGFQILDLQDFPGQGTALVGILDAFMDNKGIISSGEWREFCSDQVIMLAFERFVYEEGEAFSYRILCTNMRPEALWEPRISVCLLDEEGEVLERREMQTQTVGTERLKLLGEGEFVLPVCGMPRIFNVKAEIEGTTIRNHYEIYAYPKTEKGKGEILVTDCAQEMKKALEEGKKVLFFGTGIKEEKAIPGTYCTDFWCYPMFASISEHMGREKPIGTMGLYIDAKHPALMQFPAKEYTTPQWWSIVTDTKLAVLDDTPVEPVVWMVDNFERNHKLGLIYEAKVGDGKLLVCQTDLREMEEPESNWLYRSLLEYAESDKFSPKQKLMPKQLENLYG